MKELELTYKRAFYIVMQHNSFANRVTLLFVGIFFLIAWLINMQSGLSFSDYGPYKYWIMGGFAIWHFSFVNIYAAKRQLSRPIKNFRVVLVENEEDKFSDKS